MTPSLLTEIIQLDQQCFPADPWSQNTWEEKSKSKNYRILTIDNGQDLDGVLIYSAILDEAELLKIFVHPQKRHTGIAGQLLQLFFKNLREQKIRICFLEVREDNPAAIALYEKNGFQKISRRKKYYRHPTCDALIFQYIFPPDNN